ncbi:MAG: ABC transporter ATP-binding protein [Betaproteobacteria bacterium]|nr:ABC transporter ATP-binding protein [Betaproteobacteria bacterium]
MTRIAHQEAQLLPDAPASSNVRPNGATGASSANLPVVRAEALTKRVATAEHELTIVNNVHFTVQAGEAVAVVGASGSGKSTLLGLLAGLDTPTSGRVLIQGTDLNSLDEDGRAALRGRLVGFVFQSFQLLPSLTARENVMLPLELAGMDQARERAEAILTRVGLGERMGHYPRQLSGGEQQRVAIARAFVTEPKLLFADEPTGNLDARTGQSMIELLFELNRERGTTLILVTHDVQLANLCGRRLTIAAGEIVESADAPGGQGAA